MEYIEVTGKSVDEAITNACLKLETSSDKIEYEVIDKGSNGLFGIFNSKPAKIKARVKSGVDSVDEEFKELWIGILTKDLKIGMNIKSINKVFKDLIPLS